MAGLSEIRAVVLGSGVNTPPPTLGSVFAQDFKQLFKRNVSSRVAKDHDGNSDFLGRLWFLNCSKLTLGEVATNGRRISAHSRI